MEETDQAGAGRALVLGSDECPADLAGDFTFTHHGGVQSGADGEKVLADFGAGACAERAGHELFVESAEAADLGHEGRPGSLNIVSVGRFAVDFVAVAGGKHNRTRHCRRSGECGCCDTGGSVAQLSNGLKVDVGVCSHQ
ncbi:hypothetical protein AHiyo4_33550 [Arthrobacter sp. Hiyo4]|nr:hypothetical protein AHiyo4_33550 [Arthrobacter sp. Hiyo4]